MEGLQEAIQYLVEIGSKTKGYREPTTIEDGGVPYMVVPEGCSVEDAEQWLPKPVRVRCQPSFIDVDSFCEYVNDHKDSDTHVYASMDDGRIGAVIDHHTRTDNGPRWGDHVPALHLQPTPDWERWMEKDGEAMGQELLADFLEEMDHTIIEPEAAAIIEVVTAMRVTSDKRFTSKVNRADGSFTFEYSEEHDTKATIKVPDKFSIHIAPYRSAEYVDLLVRLRYRINEGHVKFFYSILRPDRAQEDAFNQVCEAVEGKLSMRPMRTV